MSFYPKNPNLDQEIQGDAAGLTTDRAFIAHQSWADPAAAGAADVLAATALASGSTTEVTASITDPDYPRVLSITGNQAGISGNVVITGTNIAGETITDTIAASGASTVKGSKAFKTVTSITLPARNGAGDTISVGTTDALGLKSKLSHDTVLVAHLNDTREGTLPTVAVDSSNLEGNTVDLNSALDGNKVDVYYCI